MRSFCTFSLKTAINPKRREEEEEIESIEEKEEEEEEETSPFIVRLGFGEGGFRFLSLSHREGREEPRIYIPHCVEALRCGEEGRDIEWQISKRIEDRSREREKKNTVLHSVGLRGGETRDVSVGGAKGGEVEEGRKEGRIGPRSEGRASEPSVCNKIKRGKKCNESIYKV